MTQIVEVIIDPRLHFLEFRRFAAAAIGGLAGPGAWYRGINKPACNPPDWLFGPVWTLLYTVMGVAAWIVWRRRHET